MEYMVCQRVNGGGGPFLGIKGHVSIPVTCLLVHILREELCRRHVMEPSKDGRWRRLSRCTLTWVSTCGSQYMRACAQVGMANGFLYIRRGMGDLLCHK